MGTNLVSLKDWFNTIFLFVDRVSARTLRNDFSTAPCKFILFGGRFRTLGSVWILSSRSRRIPDRLPLMSVKHYCLICLPLLYHLMLKSLVSKETVVPRRKGSERQKFGIKQKWHHREQVTKLASRDSLWRRTGTRNVTFVIVQPPLWHQLAWHQLFRRGCFEVTVNIDFLFSLDSRLVFSRGGLFLQIRAVARAEKTCPESVIRWYDIRWHVTSGYWLDCILAGTACYDPISKVMKLIDDNSDKIRVLLTLGIEWMAFEMAWFDFVKSKCSPMKGNPRQPWIQYS